MKRKIDSITVLEDIGETIGYLEIYADRKIQLAKLEAAEKTAKVTAALTTSLVLGFFSLIIMCTLSAAFGLYLQQALEVSYATAFLLLSGIYVVFGALLYTFRQQLITNPILEAVIKTLFNK